MTEAEWLTAATPRELIESLWGKICARRIRLFDCACCRRIWHLLPDPCNQRAVEISELFADDLATEAELETARVTSWLTRPRPVDRISQLDHAAAAASMVANPDLLTKPYQVLHDAACAGGDVRTGMSHQEYFRAVRPEEIAQAELFRDIFANPFRPVPFNPEWRTETVDLLARQMYESRDFSAMPILADALQDAGCDNADILDHCRGSGPHCRGCWALDLVLGLGSVEGSSG